MKKLSFFILLNALFISGISAQGRQWQWAQTETQPNNPQANAIGIAVATDPAGNAVVTGYFYTDSITFGNYTLYNTDPSGSTTDIFLVKYDPSGNVLWAASAGGPANDYAGSVATDKTGNIIVAGSFSSYRASFGSFTIYNHGTSDTISDIYVAKYGPDGHVIGAESYGGNYYDGGTGVATDPSGNIYVSGYFCSDFVAFGPYISHDMTGYGYANAFLLKLDSSGLVMWVETGYSEWGAAAYAVCTDPFGNAFVTGTFVADSITFGTQAVQGHYTGWEDIFLVKYDPSGNALWAQDAGGSLSDIPSGVAADPHGNSYITGYFNSPVAYFGPVQATNNSTSGYDDIFVAKYDPYGNPLWANAFGGDSNNVGQSISVDTGSNVYLAGYFYSPQTTFGNLTIYNYDVYGYYPDIFVAQLDSSGNSTMAMDIGGQYYDVGTGIAAGNAQTFWLTGYFESPDIDFGNYSLTDNLSNYGLYSFAAQYGPNRTTGIITAKQLPAVSLYPDPANNILTAQSEDFVSTEVTASVYDVAGALVPVGYTVSSGRVSLDVSQLAAGMYWVKFDVNGIASTAKFVKAGQ